MRELIDGVWQVPRLIPHLINCYLIRTSDGDVLLDAGTRWYTRKILAALSGYNLALVALTHVHPDHQGAVAAVCQKFGVPVACHAADAAAMEGSQPMQPSSLAVRFGDWIWSGPPHPVARRLHEGDHVGEWQVIHTPGHTPGHVSYFRARDRAVIVGDVVRSSFVLAGKLIEPPRLFSADPELNRQSIRKLLELRPSFLCFGHGPPTALVTGLEQLAARFERQTTAVKLAVV